MALRRLLHPILIEVPVQPCRHLGTVLEPDHRGKDHNDSCKQVAPRLVGAPSEPLIQGQLGILLIGTASDSAYRGQPLTN